MFKIYSKGCEYTLRALTQIDLKQSEEVFLIKDLCKRAEVSESSTRKGFQTLVREGILNAASGPGGGYRLLKDPKKISLLHIIKAIDGEDVFDQCIMGLSECDKGNPCPAHHTWVKAKKGMMQEMQVKTLAELIKSVRRNIK